MKMQVSSVTMSGREEDSDNNGGQDKTKFTILHQKFTTVANIKYSNHGRTIAPRKCVETNDVIKYLLCFRNINLYVSTSSYLTRGILSSEKRKIREGLILKNFNALAASSLIFAGFRNCVQLCYLVLKRKPHRISKRSPFRSFSNISLRVYTLGS